MVGFFTQKVFTTLPTAVPLQQDHRRMRVLCLEAHILWPFFPKWCLVLQIWLTYSSFIFLQKSYKFFFLPQFHLTQLPGCYPNLSRSPIGSPKQLAYRPTQPNAALLPWETVIKISFTSLKIIFGRDAKVNEFLLLLIWLLSTGHSIS